MEQVRCILRNIKKPKMFGAPDTYNVAVTDSRCIFARLTTEMLRRAAAEANRQGKEEGKGLLSRWGDQMAATLRYGDRYLAMLPEDILKENRENFAIDHRDIKDVSFREKRRVEDAGKIVRRIYGEVTFNTVRGRTTYQVDGMPVDEITAMRVVLGDKVRG